MSRIRTSNNLSVYSIDSSTGFPTQLLHSPFTVGTTPVFVQWDLNGKWLYVGSQSARQIFAYTFDAATFALTSNSQSATTSVAPTSMAVTK